MGLLRFPAVVLTLLAGSAFAYAQVEPQREPSPTEPIAYFEMTRLWDAPLGELAQRRRLWDEMHLAASLQGLVNREAPRLYLRCLREPDDFWWRRVTEQGEWLAGRPVVTIHSLEELLSRFRSHYQGVVVWDERVPATSNLASTIAGCDRLLCVRYDEAPDSLYRKLVHGPHPLEVKVRLLSEDGSPLFTGKGVIPGTRTPSTGSAKCDAYLWLVEHYVKTGKTDPLRLGYYLDAFWLRAYAAAAPHAQGGAYYGPRGFYEAAGGGVRPAKVPERARNEADCQRLWELSEPLTGVSYPKPT